MDRIRICIQDTEERMQELSVSQTGNAVSFSLPEIHGKQFLLLCSFSETAGIADLMLKDSRGSACLCYAENGVLAGSAILSEDPQVRIRVIRPENCDGKTLSGTFAAVEMPGGKAVVEAVSCRMNEQEKQIREYEEKISILTDRVKNGRYAREVLQKEAIWKTYMEDMRKAHGPGKRSAVSRLKTGLGQALRRLGRIRNGNE